MSPLTTAQIGRCGELLLQYALLRYGIESAPMSTDAGIDLVAYSQKSKLPQTIQVKTNLKPKPGGGKGKPVLDWWLPHDSPAQLIALVDLSEHRIWMFKTTEIPKFAQQKSETKFHIYMHTAPSYKPIKAGKLAHVRDFGGFLLENRMLELIGV